jgi:antitoxin component of RelBE/YafQ-DinJ toxin-antitoxin module
MNTAVLNIKTDPKIKQQLKIFAAQMGLPVSALVNAQIRQMLRSGEVHLTSSLEPTPYLEKIMLEADEDIKKGKNLSPVFDSVDDMFEHLEKPA